MNAEFSGMSEAAKKPEPGAFVPCRFKLKDRVVTFENDKCHWFTIDRIILDWRKGGCSYEVGAYVSGSNSSASWCMFNESRCFLTKAELLATL